MNTTQTIYNEFPSSPDFIDNLKQEILKSKMTTKEIAKKAKCKQSDIEKFMNDEIEGINVLRRVINYLFN